MTKPTTATPPPAPEGIPPLQSGERLDQKTFHERYEAMPASVRAELIGGQVHMPSPLKVRHGRSDIRLHGWLMLYQAATPGTDIQANTTTIVSDDSEPQPDSSLVILPECGGQTTVGEDDYLHGAPELVAEVSWSQEQFDLGPKLRDYEQAGVREYLVVLLRREEVRWYVLRNGTFVLLEPGSDDLLRSELFGGLWLDPQALLRRDSQRVIEVLNQGLASPAHADFVERLRRP